jgi:hypothetical protein
MEPGVCSTTTQSKRNCGRKQNATAAVYSAGETGEWISYRSIDTISSRLTSHAESRAVQLPGTNWSCCFFSERLLQRLEARMFSFLFSHCLTYDSGIALTIAIVRTTLKGQGPRQARRPKVPSAMWDMHCACSLCIRGHIIPYCVFIIL